MRRAGAARQLLLFAFVFGCAVSGAVSGRFTARLILDGMISFAFVPIFELLAFATIWNIRLTREQRHARPWASAVTSFLEGNQPWLLWLVIACALFAALPPRAIGPWIRLLAFSTIVPIGWSIRIDLRFFRTSLLRSSGAALLDVIVFRAIAWTLGLGYFLGIAIWAELGL
jgi:hypothetical protein